MGAEYRMTNPMHQSGTDRCAEVAQQLVEEIIINVQGDEPFIDVDAVLSLIELLESSHEVQIATLISPLKDQELVKDRNTVKVVSSASNRALYFSRSVIPHSTEAAHFKHIGVYGFKREVLLELAKLPPSKLELAESLEQLRWLENDYTIHTVLTDMEGNSIDTLEDLKRAEQMMSDLLLGVKPDHK